MLFLRALLLVICFSAFSSTVEASAGTAMGVPAAPTGRTLPVARGIMDRGGAYKAFITMIIAKAEAVRAAAEPVIAALGARPDELADPDGALDYDVQVYDHWKNAADTNDVPVHFYDAYRRLVALPGYSEAELRAFLDTNLGQGGYNVPRAIEFAQDFSAAWGAVFEAANTEMSNEHGVRQTALEARARAAEQARAAAEAARLEAQAAEAAARLREAAEQARAATAEAARDQALVREQAAAQQGAAAVERTRRLLGAVAASHASGGGGSGLSPAQRETVGHLRIAIDAWNTIDDADIGDADLPAFRGALREFARAWSEVIVTPSQMVKVVAAMPDPLKELLAHRSAGELADHAAVQAAAGAFDFATNHPAAHPASELVGNPLSAEEVASVKHFTVAVNDWDVNTTAALGAGPDAADVLKLQKLQRFTNMWRQPDVHPRQKTAVLGAMPEALRTAVTTRDVATLRNLIAIVDAYDAEFRFEEQIPHVKYPISGVGGGGGAPAPLTEEETAHVGNMMYAITKWDEAVQGLGGGGGDVFIGQVAAFVAAWQEGGIHDRQKLALYVDVPAAIKDHVDNRTDAELSDLDQLRAVNEDGSFVIAAHMPANHPAPAGGGLGDGGGMGAADAALLAGRDFTDPDELFQLLLELAATPGRRLSAGGWPKVVRLMGQVADRIQTVESSKFKPRLATPFEQIVVPAINWGDYTQARSLFDSARSLVRVAWTSHDDPGRVLFDFTEPVPTGQFPDFPSIHEAALPQILDAALGLDDRDGDHKFAVEVMNAFSPSRLGWFGDPEYDAAIAAAGGDPLRELQARIASNGFISSMGRLYSDDGVLNFFRIAFSLGLDLDGKIVDSKNTGVSLLGKTLQRASIDFSFFKHQSGVFTNFGSYNPGLLSETSFMFELAAVQRGVGVPETEAAYEAMLVAALAELNLSSMHQAIVASRIPFERVVAAAGADAAAVATAGAENFTRFKTSLRGSVLDFLVWTTLLARDAGKIAQFENGRVDGDAEVDGFHENDIVRRISAYLKDIRLLPGEGGDVKYNKALNFIRLLERMRQMHSRSISLAKRFTVHPVTATKIRANPGLLKGEKYDASWGFADKAVVGEAELKRTYRERFSNMVFVRADEDGAPIRSAATHDIVEATPNGVNMRDGTESDADNPDHFYWKILQPLHNKTQMGRIFVQEAPRQYANFVRFVIAVDPEDAAAFATPAEGGNFVVVPETEAYVQTVGNYLGQRNANTVATTAGKAYPAIIQRVKTVGDQFDSRVKVFISEPYLERLGKVSATLARFSALSELPAAEHPATSTLARHLLAVTGALETLRGVNPVSQMAKDLGLDVGTIVTFNTRAALAGERGAGLLAERPEGLAMEKTGLNLLSLISYLLKPVADRTPEERKLLPIIPPNLAVRRGQLLNSYVAATKYANLDVLMRHLKFYKLKVKFTESLAELGEQVATDLPWVVRAPAGPLAAEHTALKAWIDAWRADGIHHRQKTQLFEAMFEDGPGLARIALKDALADGGAPTPAVTVLLDAGGALAGVDFATTWQVGEYAAPPLMFAGMPASAADRPKIAAIDRLMADLSAQLEGLRPLAVAPVSVQYTDISKRVRNNVEGALRRIVCPYIWGPGEPTAEERTRHAANGAAPMNVIAGDRVLDYVDDAWGIAPDGFRVDGPDGPQSYGILKYSSRKLVFGFEDALAIAIGMAEEPDDANIQAIYGPIKGKIKQLDEDYKKLRTFALEGQDPLGEADAQDETDLNLAPDFAYRVDAWGAGKPVSGGGLVEGIDPAALQQARTEKSLAAAAGGLGGLL